MDGGDHHDEFGTKALAVEPADLWHPGLPFPGSACARCSRPRDRCVPSSLGAHASTVGGRGCVMALGVGGGSPVHPPRGALQCACMVARRLALGDLGAAACGRSPVSLELAAPHGSACSDFITAATA